MRGAHLSIGVLLEKPFAFLGVRFLTSQNFLEPTQADLTDGEQLRDVQLEPPRHGGAQHCEGGFDVEMASPKEA